MVLIIGIFGSSGSGKTTIANKLVEKFNAVIVNMDNFYYGIDKNMSNRDEYIKSYNFDLPDAINWTSLRNTIHELRYRPVTIDQYDFTIHTHSEDSKIYVDSSDSEYMVVEGIHAWKLADICDLLVYVNTDLDECFRRRLDRDERERGRTDTGEIISNWDKKVKPAYREYILPNAYKAHFELRNEDPHKHAHLNCLYSIVELLGKYPLYEIKL